MTFYEVCMVAITVVAAYFLGCFNGAVIVSKYILRDDVRTHGSGNAGLTNFFRTFGGPLTFLVILTDVLKAVLAVLIGAALFGQVFADPMLGRYVAGLLCLVGHMFPCMFGFQGGKGILSGGTVAIMIDWRLAMLAWGLFLLLAVVTRYVSLGSILAGASFPVGTWLFVSREPLFLSLAVLIATLIVWKHWGNFRRLIKGEESKFSFHRKS